MANNSEVTLIHANWCGHCTRYLPKWNDSISSILQENGIQAGQLEQSDSNFESLSKIDGTPVRGFPTLKVKVNNIEKEFNGNRDNAQEIVDFVKTLQSSQSPGLPLLTAGPCSFHCKPSLLVAYQISASSHFDVKL